MDGFLNACDLSSAYNIIDGSHTPLFQKLNKWIIIG
jgi:hypothetical protein